MRQMFVADADMEGIVTEQERLNAVEMAFPWAAEIIPCDGGYAVFESVQDAAIWQRQK